MRRILLALLFMLPAISLAGSLTFTYTRPTHYVDGTPIPADKVLTYAIYAAPEGMAPGEVNRSTGLRQVIPAAAGRWCAQVFVVNENVYSDPSPSPAWCGTVPAAPTEPAPAPTRKTRPAGSVVVTSSAEEPAQ